ncbi:MAG: hypothetical protein WAX89_06960 [Alphaproteobacteria bacterium]
MGKITVVAYDFENARVLSNLLLDRLNYHDGWSTLCVMSGELVLQRLVKGIPHTRLFWHTPKSLYVGGRNCVVIHRRTKTIAPLLKDLERLMRKTENRFVRGYAVSHN